MEHRVRPGLTTPVEIGIVDADGGRTYFQRRDHSALAALQAPSSPQLSGAELLYVDWYDGPSVLAAMETAVSLGVPVFLNLESQYSRNPSLSDLMRYATICQVSMDEPGSSGSPVDTARSLINLGMETVLVTLGAEGCLVAQGQQAYCIKAPRVKVVDCYGAGAAFSAGIIYGFRGRMAAGRQRPVRHGLRRAQVPGGRYRGLVRSRDPRDGGYPGCSSLVLVNG